MDKALFDSLPPLKQLEAVRDALAKARNPYEVFGPEKGMKKAFRNLSKFVHPDSRAGADDDPIAADAFSRLKELWGMAEAQMDENTYGNPPADSMVAQIHMGAKTVDVVSSIREGDITDLYGGVDDDGEYLIYVARDEAVNDLLDNEAHQLKSLNRQAGYIEQGARYIPEYTGGAMLHGRNINVLKANLEFMPGPDELYPLRDIAEAYGNRLPHKAIGWLWTRLLAGMVFAHDNGIIHANLTPDTILVDPVDHGILLTGWYHASAGQVPVTSISPDWEAHYPPEVLRKELPLPCTDVYMAARALRWACTDMPEPMQRYFDWCTHPNTHARPGKFQLLLDEWKRTMYEHMGWQREFVVLDYKPGANGVDWGWWR